MKMSVLQTALLAACACAGQATGFGDDGNRLLRIDHYVPVPSAVPAIAGQATQIYVREVVEASTVLRGGPAGDRVALFIHGAGTPAEVCLCDGPLPGLQLDGIPGARGLRCFFDGYDWLRPFHAPSRDAEFDPCNLAHDQQATFIPSLILRGLAPPLYPHQMTTRLLRDWQRYRRGCRSHSRAASCRKIERTGVVSRRTAFGGICGAASRQSRETGVAGPAPTIGQRKPMRRPRCPRTAAAMNTQSREEFIAQLGSPGGLR